MSEPLPVPLERYHPRRLDKEMPERLEQLAVLRAQFVMTLAMCQNHEPYLVSLDYIYDEDDGCFYAHCAKSGKKMDILREAPRVWGQVVEDRGPVAGACTHSYRSVMFAGRVDWVSDPAEKMRILERMIEKYEPEPGAVKSSMLQPGQVGNVMVMRIRVASLSGKQSPPPAKK